MSEEIPYNGKGEKKKDFYTVNVVALREDKLPGEFREEIGCRKTFFNLKRNYVKRLLQQSVRKKDYF
ncbi:hypothetical protein CEXT_609461 [Caerostris extrusa]|uniref:Uncharacterized protein n=1 Tax=Caerostris extrusa TaxID=172846 RepID=A0AAV4YG22_CAEEX|nr:hypothetical protein CEXT_609461 [Caerostris extrusa]